MNIDIAIHILKLCAGIGLFLFGMYLLEESLKNLSGRSFKLFLQRMTKNRIAAVAGGAIVTGILQSSSMVSLMVLAFVGAGVFTMKNAMAIILGANLGTTLDTWLVATLGFKVNIEVAAYPAVFIGGMLLILFGNRKLFKYISYFLLGFGLLFIGLSFMKTAMDVYVLDFDFTKYAHMSLAVFLLIGFFITLLVQSSSVTMALTLSALHAGAIGFAPAAAIALGSETGTTIKIALSSIGGNASKKQVVLGHILFNIFLTVFAFIFLKPILLLITDILSVQDPLIGLVTFSSLINLLSILIFLPLLDPFSKFLEGFFTNTDASAAAYISHANIKEPETALDLFRKETSYLIYNSMLFNLEQFKIDIKKYENHPDFKKLNEQKRFFSKTLEEKYEFLKQLQGELQLFYLELRETIQDTNSSQLNQLISSIRSSMYSVKSINDIRHNIENLRRSSKNIKYDFFIQNKNETEELYRRLHVYLSHPEKTTFMEFQDIYDGIQNNYSSALNGFYKNAQHQPIEEIDMTIAINFNRELYTSNKAMLMAVKDFLLEEKLAQEFNEMLVYKT
jgi:phosphate:Na+ symporter